MFCAYSLGIKGRSSISRTESRDKVPIEFRWLCRTESRVKLPIEFEGIEVFDPSSSSIFTTEGIELSKSARLWRLANCRRSVIDPRLFRLARRLLIESWCFCASGVSSPYSVVILWSSASLLLSLLRGGGSIIVVRPRRHIVLLCLPFLRIGSGILGGSWGRLGFGSSRRMSSRRLSSSLSWSKRQGGNWNPLDSFLIGLIGGTSNRSQILPDTKRSSCLNVILLDILNICCLRQYYFTALCFCVIVYGEVDVWWNWFMITKIEIVTTAVSPAHPCCVFWHPFAGITASALEENPMDLQIPDWISWFALFLTVSRIKCVVELNGGNCDLTWLNFWNYKREHKC